MSNDFNGVNLGDKVEDVITDFQGVVTGLVHYLSGCNQALVVPKVGADGAARDGSWMDVQRLRILQAGAIRLDNGNTPGGFLLPPKR